MWFKNGLKAQKLQKQHALKGQKLLAQGIALGIIAISKAPCKGKSFVNCPVFKAFALTGRQVCVHNTPGRCPGLGASALSGRVGQNLRNFSKESITTDKYKLKTFIIKAIRHFFANFAAKK